jgi:hypothetical protein
MEYVYVVTLLESFRAFDQYKYLGFLLLGIFHLESERRAPCISCPSRAKILRFENGVQLLIIIV